MTNKIIQSNPFGAVSSADIQVFETEISLTLTEDYKAYLAAHNGGDFEKNHFSTKSNPKDYLVLEELFSLNCGEGYRNLNENWNFAESCDLGEFATGLSKYVFIGSGICGVCVLLNLEKGQVSMYDPDHIAVETATELVATLEPIAETFSAFIAGLKHEGEVDEEEC
ncbi:SMI1/KNR4 family protein [Parasedimentitalea huanghaiensis]|uniref:Knr4/Smi1-like domain-containing protein n=1 Tax=Parasedimentitalea huanghaiensis TaxID=2682100 RepID=A0A6L6WI72_9RHOB|nr:SMI1/KNR4 family protein [Zongyanglinia huanghaiensis]MVO17526.1 hypothetical protein [Zongyanglinia huanghaiensis]